MTRMMKALALMLLTGCHDGAGPRVPGFCADEKLYTAALLRCVDKATTIVESKACRAEVDKTCGISETVTVRRVAR
jgi:hypothetical protein